MHEQIIFEVPIQYGCSIGNCLPQGPLHDVTSCCSLEWLIHPQRKALWQVPSQVTEWRSPCQPANDTLKRGGKGRKCSSCFPLQHKHEGFISLIHGRQCQGSLELQRQRNNQFSNPLQLHEGKEEKHICPHRAVIALLPTPSPEKAELGEGTAPPITRGVN